MFCLAALGFFKLRIYLTDFLIWFIVINIHNRIYPALTGGDYLLNQLLFFNIFISGKYILKNDWKNQIKKCLHNLGVFAIMTQICLVYFFSALAKLHDENWLNGTAVLMTSQVDHFSLPIISNNAARFTFLLVFLNYLVLFYQVLFPIVIWIKKIKKTFIVIGILMHLYIAFVMGLVSFGLIMILPYIYFWPEKKK